MKLDGIHHITAITANAQRNVDFYAGTLGLRMVKKTVRVGSEDALGFWSERLEAAGSETRREGGSLRFADPEGLEHELVEATVDDQPLIADHPEIPREQALQGFDGARAYAPDVERSRGLIEEALGFEPHGDGWEVRGKRRGGIWAYDEPPPERGLQGAGTVHHIAWASETEEHAEWRRRAAEGGAHPTPVIDRFWFESIYFREPSGVLFEIATLDPGFAVDEYPAHLGESLILPPFLEDRREEIERVLTPVSTRARDDPSRPRSCGRPGGRAHPQPRSRL